MNQTLSDLRRDCWYAAPGREAWYDPRVMAVYINLDEEPDFNSREEAVSEIARQKGWVFDHEMWHSQCRDTTAMEAVFLLNSYASIQTTKPGPVQRNKESNVTSIKKLDRLARSLASSSELPMEAYALTMEYLPTESRDFEYLNKDVQRLSSEIGEERAADLISAAAWKALNPDLAGSEGIHNLIQRLAIDSNAADVDPERRFLDSLDYIFNNRTRFELEGENTYSEIPLQTAERSLLVESCPSIYKISPEKIASLAVRHVDEGPLSNAETWIEHLQPIYQWASFLCSPGTAMIWQILRDVSGPLYFCLYHQDRILYVLNPEIAADSFDHKVVYNILSSHFEKEKYLIQQGTSINEKREGELRISEKAEYAPYGKYKNGFKPDSKTLRLFEAESTGVSTASEVVSQLRLTADTSEEAQPLLF